MKAGSIQSYRSTENTKGAPIFYPNFSPAFSYFQGLKIGKWTLTYSGIRPNWSTIFELVLQLFTVPMYEQSILFSQKCAVCASMCDGNHIQIVRIYQHIRNPRVNPLNGKMHNVRAHLIGSTRLNKVRASSRRSAFANSIFKRAHSTKQKVVCSFLVWCA